MRSIALLNAGLAGLDEILVFWEAPDGSAEDWSFSSAAASWGG
jgi:hypothetical protein